MTPRRKALLAALRDPEARVRAAAAQALDRLDSREVVPALLARTSVPTPTGWVRLLRSLAGSRDDSCLKLALRALDHAHEDVRLAALELIGSFRDWRATPRVGKALTDSSALVRGRAARVLGDLGDRRGADRVAALLEDGDPRVVAQAAETLGLLGHVDAEERLLALAADQDPDVRTAALGALGRLGFSPGP